MSPPSVRSYPARSRLRGLALPVLIALLLTGGWAVGAAPHSGAAPSAPALAIQPAVPALLSPPRPAGPPTFPVEFNETGLPSGAWWNVTLAGVSESSNSSEITFFEPNGTYAYNVNGPATSLQNGSPSNGTVRVVGAPNSIEVPSGIPVGSGPDGIAYDPVNGYLYVSNFGSENITVINATTNTVVNASLNDSWGPGALVYDPLDGYLYVTNTLSDNLSVLDPVNDSWVGSGIYTGGEPTPIVFDSDNGDLYVANFAYDTLSVLYGSNGTLFTSFFPGGALPYGMAFDPANGDLYLANGNSENITIINGTTNAPSGNFYNGGAAEASTLGYDPNTGDIYSCSADAYGVIINGSSNSEVGSTPILQCWSVVADPVSGQLYFQQPDTVAVVDAATDTEVVDNIPTGSSEGGPQTIVYDPANGFVYAANYGSDNVSVINGNGVVSTQWVSKPTSTVTFDESGLPANTEWWANLSNGASLHTDTSEVSVALLEGNYTYRLSCANPQYSPATLNGTLNLTGAPVGVLALFVPFAYSVGFSESGLPAGAAWWVNVTGGPSVESSTSVLAFTEQNGTYPYSLGSANRSYRSAGGSFSVDGNSLNEQVTFVPATYNVTFTETGLPLGATWNVSVGFTNASTAGTTLTVLLLNGTYLFTVGPPVGYRAAPASGTVLVSGPSSPIPITFTAIPVPVEYPITFTEVGLASGTTWYVVVSGTVDESSDTSSIGFQEVNGSYPYTVTPVSGYNATPRAGTVQVTGRPANVAIMFNATVTHTPPPPGGGSTGSGSSGISTEDLYLLLAVGVVVVVVAAAVVLRSRRGRPPASASPAETAPPPDADEQVYGGSSPPP